MIPSIRSVVCRLTFYLPGIPSYFVYIMSDVTVAPDREEAYWYQCGERLVLCEETFAVLKNELSVRF
jgi:hypothetical protein